MFDLHAHRLSDLSSLAPVSEALLKWLQATLPCPQSLNQSSWQLLFTFMYLCPDFLHFSLSGFNPSSFVYAVNLHSFNLTHSRINWIVDTVLAVFIVYSFFLSALRIWGKSLTCFCRNNRSTSASRFDRSSHLEKLCDTLVIQDINTFFDDKDKQDTLVTTSSPNQLFPVIAGFLYLVHLS